jgi:hypothetical protein
LAEITSTDIDFPLDSIPYDHEPKDIKTVVSPEDAVGGSEGGSEVSGSEDPVDPAEVAEDDEIRLEREYPLGEAALKIVRRSKYPIVCHPSDIEIFGV